MCHGRPEAALRLFMESYGPIRPMMDRLAWAARVAISNTVSKGPNTTKDGWDHIDKGRVEGFGSDGEPGPVSRPGPPRGGGLAPRPMSPAAPWKAAGA